MNNVLKKLWPVYIAIAIVIGIILGNRMAGNSESRPASLINLSQGNKLSTLIEMIDKEYVDTVNKKEIIEEVIPDILDKLDPHSVYIPAKDLQSVNEELNGSFGGIGVQFNIQDDTVMVIQVVSGGPSEKVGIMAGDRIVMVNDTSFTGDKISNTKVMNTLRGEKGTKVKIGVVRPGMDGVIDFEIIRGDIPTYSVDVSYMINKTTGYIKVSRNFGRNTFEEFLNALAKVQYAGCKSVIVDLRGNQGGYLEVVNRMVDEFLQRGELIVYTEGKAFPRTDYRADGHGSMKSVRLAVLIDEWSASASEIFAGAIQDNDRGVIIGRRSFGKGLVQTQMGLGDGSAVRLTISRYYTPSGRCIQKSYKNGNKDYYKDIMERYQNGEMNSEDSIHLNKAEKYHTVNGRLVYGGGGIMPDIFVPVDTTGITPLFENLVRKGLIYKFAFRYTDEHRQELNKLADVDALLDYYKDHPVMEMFLDMAKNEWHVKIKPEDLKVSGRLIETQVKAYIARNIFDNDGFYPIFNTLDATIDTAVAVLNEPGVQYNAILTAK
ncbi:S41 family peptidase [Saccharicrinis sp. FJH62]|uniref:S41 family peptidase n=1 Tax=Saccharicrinis sp. FJH62 TaxID=3344657 RepID=UPI0035D44656